MQGFAGEVLLHDVALEPVAFQRAGLTVTKRKDA
jgi:hypothetical protein